MLQRVAETISRYSMFRRGQTVAVAVSGGADSVCLLHVLLELAPAWALRLRVIHLDHELRGDASRADADFVREMASRLGLEMRIGRADVACRRGTSGANLEEAGREARREFFRECLKSGFAERIALGHTRSDQAETVLFRLLRGCGTTGLTGILPVTAEGLVRPLLAVDRKEVEGYLRERNIPWREDATNCDLRFARNRIRHELLPALSKGWNPALPHGLARLAALAGEEELYWETEVNRLAAELLRLKPPAVILDATALRALAPPLARRLLRRAIREAKGDLRQIGFGHIDELLRLAETERGHGRVQVPGLVATRSFGWVRFAPAGLTPASTHGFHVLMNVPGTTDVPAASLRLELRQMERPSDWKTGNCLLDCERIKAPLEVRNWRPGDRYQPSGSDHPQQVKSLFQKSKVPLWERRDWPVIVSNHAIVWVRQFGAAAAYAAALGSRSVLKIVETAWVAGSVNPE